MSNLVLGNRINGEKMNTISWCYPGLSYFKAIEGHLSWKMVARAVSLCLCYVDHRRLERFLIYVMSIVISHPHGRIFSHVPIFCILTCLKDISISSFDRNIFQNKKLSFAHHRFAILSSTLMIASFSKPFSLSKS